jgi:hypothetical protein
LQQELKNLEEQITQIQMQPIEQQYYGKEASLELRYEQTLTKLTDSYLQRAKKNIG